MLQTNSLGISSFNGIMYSETGQRHTGITDFEGYLKNKHQYHQKSLLY